MLITPSEALPYPVPTDFAALPVHLQNFASALDAKWPGWDSAFTSIVKDTCFLYRTGLNSSAVASGSQIFPVWDTKVFSNLTTGSVSSGSFRAPPNDTAWWMVGCTIPLLNAGTVTVNAISRIELEPIYSGYGFADTPGAQPAPTVAVGASSARVTGAMYGESAETNQGGEVIQAVGIFRMFGTSSSIFCIFGHNDPGASATRTILAGAQFWGIRLGSA